MKKKNLWSLTRSASEPGTYTGIVRKIRKTSDEDGFQIILKIKESKKERKESIISKGLYDYLYKDINEAKDCLKFTGYYRLWKHCGNEDEEEIEALIYKIRIGEKLKIRISKSIKSNHYYIRYIKKENTGEYSGFEEELNFQSTNNNPFPFSTTTSLTFSSILKSTNEPETYHITAYHSDDKTFGTYSFVISDSSAAFSKIKEIENKNTKQKYNCLCEYDKENDTSYILDILNSNTKNKTTKKRNFAKEKEEAEKYEKIKNEDEKAAHKDNLLFLEGKIEESEYSDYESSQIQYVKVHLSDGRTIMPRMRSDIKEERRKETEKEINLLRHKSLIYPNLKVKLIFKENKKRENAILIGIMADKEIEDLKKEKEEWKKKKIKKKE